MREDNFSSAPHDAVFSIDKIIHGPLDFDFLAKDILLSDFRNGLGGLPSLARRLILG